MPILNYEVWKYTFINVRPTYNLITLSKQKRIRSNRTHLRRAETDDFHKYALIFLFFHDATEQG
jgi:hypothetical protein